jgi:hypothetical protein
LLIGFLIALGTLCFTSCASYTEHIAEVDGLYSSKQYDSALQALESSVIKEQDRNRLLFAMEKGMILDRKGDLIRSRRAWLEADKIADELYTVSVSKLAASFLYNDSIVDYAGEDYEVVNLHTMLALSFLEEAKYREARIEAVKINNKLAEINSRYDEGKNKYEKDAFAYYLSGLIFEKLGEWDSAIIDYRKSLAAFQGEFKGFNRGGVPDSLVEALARLYQIRNRKQELSALRESHPKLLAFLDKSDSQQEEKGQVLVLHELGQVSKKVRSEFVLPISGQIVRFSFPVMDSRTYGAGGRTGIEWGRVNSSKSYVAAESLVDFNAVAYQTLEDKRLRFTLKATVRLLAKGQLTYQAEKNFGLFGKLAGMAYSTVTETADTRSWSLLPGAVFVSRIWLDPGEYHLGVLTEGRGQSQVVKVKAGEMVIIRDK